MAAPLDRRTLLKSAALAAVASVGPLVSRAPAAVTKPHVVHRDDPFGGLKIGLASYSYRKLSLDAAIKGTRRVGLRYVSIKSFHLPLESTTEQRKDVAAQFIAAGITPVSCGVIRFKNDEKSSRHSFEYARDLGVGTIVAMPDRNALPLLNRLVPEYNIRLAIHNHGPEDHNFPSPYDVAKAVEKLDPRIGYCIDIGHAARAGADPAQAIRDLRDRLYDLHLKDVSDVHGRSSRAEVVIGRGVLDIRAMLQALLDIDYKNHANIEHEPDAADPIPGVAESVGYLKGTLSDMKRA